MAYSYGPCTGYIHRQDMARAEARYLAEPVPSERQLRHARLDAELEELIAHRDQIDGNILELEESIRDLGRWGVRFDLSALRDLSGQVQRLIDLAKSERDDWRCA